MSNNLKTQKLGLTLVIALVITTMLLASYHYFYQPKTGYILIQEVYNGFDFKKEMERKFLTIKTVRQKKLDSLEVELKLLGNRLSKMSEKERSDKDLDDFGQLREEFLKRKKMNEEDNAQLSHQYDTEILTQLNQYIKDFGNEKNYTYIFGNDGNGSLMFGKEQNNISKEVIEFVNKKYNGKALK